MAYYNVSETERPKARVRFPSSLARLEQIGIEHTNRRILQIEDLLTDLDHSATALQNEIEIEQRRAPIHPRYPHSTFAKAAMVRWQNLRRSAEELRRALDALRASMSFDADTPRS